MSARLPILIAAVIGALALTSAAHAAVPCPEGARCGTVTVPLDRSDPSAGTIGIAYAYLPRTDTRRPSLGTIVPNPGGPGNGTIAQAGLYTGALTPLRARRDLLLVDVRGTGASGALVCPSLAQADPLSLDHARIGVLCGRDLGTRARLYDTAAAADDIDAVRAALGLRKLDLWGDSYGTFLMPVYAARHPRHVRSIVLDGAFPVSFDPWGRDILHSVRRAIRLVCARTHRCSGDRVLTRLGELAGRLRRHPVSFTTDSPIGPVRLRLDERELAQVAWGAGDPSVYGPLPAALAAALHGRLGPMKRLVLAERTAHVGGLLGDPQVVSIGAGAAVECHDYPRAFDLAASPARRRAQYRRALTTLARRDFRPFSRRAWLRTDIDAGPKCLDWPADPTAGSPLRGRRMPDVPVLVQSGDLDTNTPVEQGRRAAAQFRHAQFAIVANAGHTPDLEPCGVAMAIDFIRRLRTDPDRCRHSGRPPHVASR